MIMDMADLDFKTMLRPPIGTGVELVKQLRARTTRSVWRTCT